MVKKLLSLTALLGASTVGTTNAAVITTMGLYNADGTYVDVSNADSSRYLRLKKNTGQVERAFKSNTSFVTDTYDLSSLGNIKAISEVQPNIGITGAGFYILRENGEFDIYSIPGTVKKELNLTLNPTTHNGGNTFLGGGSVAGETDLFAGVVDNNTFGIWNISNGNQLWKGDLSSIVGNQTLKDIAIKEYNESNGTVKFEYLVDESSTVGDRNTDFQLTAVPEPSYLGFGITALALAGYRRRERR